MLLNSFINFLVVAGLLFFSPVADASGDETEISQIDLGKDGRSFFFFRDDTLPVVRLSFIFKNVGYSYDGPEKSGLSHIAMNVFSGVGGVGQTDFASDLKKNGIELRTSVSSDFITVYLTCFTEDFDKALSLVLSRFQGVHFETQELEIARNRQVSAIRFSEKDPDYLAMNNLSKMMYRSSQYAYSYLGNLDSVKAITFNDVVKFFSYAFDSSQMKVSVVGDVDIEKLKKSLGGVFSALSSGVNKNKVIDKPAFPDVGENSYILLGVPQTTIYFAKEALQCSDEKYPILDLMNTAMGNMSLGSVLMDELRSKRALVYGASTAVLCNKNHGVLIGVARADSKNSADAINVMKGVLVSLANNGFDRSYFNKAKNVLLNNQERRFSSSVDILSFMTYIQANGLGVDYYERYVDAIENATLEELNTLTRSLINREKVFFIEVGSKNDFQV